MFQRRMLLVANQLQNTQLTAPKLFSSSKKKNQEESNDDDDDDDDGNGDGGCDVEDVDNAATDNSQTTIINNNAASSAVGKATASATITTIKSKLSAKPSIPKDFDTFFKHR
jgi:hypothetical protein